MAAYQPEIVITRRDKQTHTVTDRDRQKQTMTVRQRKTDKTDRQRQTDKNRQKQTETESDKHQQRVQKNYILHKQTKTKNSSLIMYSEMKNIYISLS